MLIYELEIKLRIVVLTQGVRSCCKEQQLGIL